MWGQRPNPSFSVPHTPYYYHPATYPSHPSSYYHTSMDATKIKPTVNETVNRIEIENRNQVDNMHTHPSSYMGGSYGYEMNPHPHSQWSSAMMTHPLASSMSYMPHFHNHNHNHCFHDVPQYHHLHTTPTTITSSNPALNNNNSNNNGNSNDNNINNNQTSLRSLTPTPTTTTTTTNTTNSSENNTDNNNNNNTHTNNKSNNTTNNNTSSGKTTENKNGNYKILDVDKKLGYGLVKMEEGYKLVKLYEKMSDLSDYRVVEYDNGPPKKVEPESLEKKMDGVALPLSAAAEVGVHLEDKNEAEKRKEERNRRKMIRKLVFGEDTEPAPKKSPTKKPIRTRVKKVVDENSPPTPGKDYCYNFEGVQDLKKVIEVDDFSITYEAILCRLKNVALEQDGVFRLPYGWDMAKYFGKKIRKTGFFKKRLFAILYDLWNKKYVSYDPKTKDYILDEKYMDLISHCDPECLTPFSYKRGIDEKKSKEGDEGTDDEESEGEEKAQEKEKEKEKKKKKEKKEKEKDKGKEKEEEKPRDKDKDKDKEGPPKKKSKKSLDPITPQKKPKKTKEKNTNTVNNNITPTNIKSLDQPNTNTQRVTPSTYAYPYTLPSPITTPPISLDLLDEEKV